MSNALYDKGREKFLEGKISWTDPTTQIKVLLVDSTYSPNLSTDEYLYQIDASKRIAISSNLSTRRATNGVASADNVTITPVSANRTIKYLVIFKDTGNESDSALIALIDTADGMPQGGIQTDTGNIVVEWDTGPNKIFKL